MAAKATRTTVVPSQDTDSNGIPSHIRERVIACLQSPDAGKLDALRVAIIAASRPTHIPSVTTHEHGRTTSVDNRGVVVVNAGDEGSIDPREAKPPRTYAEMARAAELSKPRAFVPGVNDSESDIRDTAGQFARK
ncbi:hypothetical protein [Bradyrhizobium embrapense]